MKKLILLILATAFISCGPPPTKYKPVKEDPLLEHIRYYREADCLRNCADSDRWCDKK